MTKTYETRATVEDEGQVRVGGVPFAPGTEVEVTVSLRRRSAAEFVAAWNRVCSEMRARQPDIEEDAIQVEIDDYRAGR